ncbi:MAG: iucA / IucC family protein [Paenibacillus sp.]|nr:iucA / IucC family protein [Paenibacillus sp.]
MSHLPVHMELCNALLSPSYLQARRRVFRQLIESLIYEGIIRADRRKIAKDEIEFTIHGTSETREPVLYRCYGTERFSFGRIRLNKHPLMRKGQEAQEQEAASLSQFMMELFNYNASTVNRSMLDMFILELEQTVLKDTMSRYMLSLEPSVSLQQIPYDVIESALVDGHPYHPCYKSRMGFDITDNDLYGPEFKRHITPIWIAIDRSLDGLFVAGADRYRKMLQEELSRETLKHFDSIVRLNGGLAESYLYVPVHPWQWERQALPAVIEELRSKRIVVLGPSEDLYRAQQSIRTLYNCSQPSKSCLKLSLHIRNTSSMRGLTPHSVACAARVSSWLHQVISTDDYLMQQSRMVILSEHAGLSYGVIGCIWRESIHLYLEQGEGAVPMNALTALEADGRPVIDHWIERQGLEYWLHCLLQVTMLPVIHLLVGHGLALEAHAQNMVLIHKDGVPSRVALKDFHEGVEYFPDYLANSGLLPDFTSLHPFYDTAIPNRGFEMDSLRLVRELTTDCLFFMNFGELAMFLADQYKYDEPSFWVLVRSVIEEHFDRFPQLQIRLQQIDLFTPTCRIEQLTRRRLYPDDSLMVHESPNPLDAAGRTTPIGIIKSFEQRRAMHT